MTLETPEAGIETGTPAVETAATQPAQAQRRRARAPERKLVDWTPDDAVTMTSQKLEICSSLLRRNVNRMGIRAQLSLYLLQRVLPSSGMITEAQRFDEAFNAKISELETEIEQGHEELRVIAKKDGITRLPDKTSTAPLEIEVPIYSPGMNRFVRVIRNLDAYYCALDYLWMNGLVTTQYQWDRINHYRRRLWGEIQFVQRSWQHAKGILKEFQEGRQAVRQAAGTGDATAETAAA